MDFSAIATVLAALPLAAATIWLGVRQNKARQDALEKLVSAAVATADANHKTEIARNDEAHRKEVEWLQKQILYYQQLSQPAKFPMPTQPPDQPSPP